MILNGEVDHGPTDFVVLVLHPTLFLVSGFPDRIYFLSLAQFFAATVVLSANILVHPSVACKLYLSGISGGNCRAFQIQINAHDHIARGSFRTRLFYRDLCDPLPVLLCDPKGAQLMGCQFLKDLCGSLCRKFDALRFPIHEKRHSDTAFGDSIVLIVPDDDRLVEDMMDVGFTALSEDTSCILDRLSPQGRGEIGKNEG